MLNPLSNPVADLLLKPIISEIVKEVAAGIKSRLRPSELEKAIKTALSAAIVQDERDHNNSEWLFRKYQPNQQAEFLSQVFKHPNTQQELQKPLERSEILDLAILTDVFKGIEAKMKLELTQGSLERWLRAFAQTYYQQTSSALNFKISCGTYCNRLLKQIQTVQFIGFAIDAQEIKRDEKLSNIFIAPNLQEELSHQTFLDRLPFQSGPEHEVYRLNAQRLHLKIKQTKPAVSADKLFAQLQSNRIVILGEPGSGKTSLLKFFSAKVMSERENHSRNLLQLPLLLSIPDLAKHSEMSVLDYARSIAEVDLGIKSMPTDFFEYWLENGNVLILLDGLDEVTELPKRQTVIKKLKTFLNHYSSNPAIITSRPAGYRRDLLNAEEFTHYSIQPFSDKHIDAFIDCWYDNRLQEPAESTSQKMSLRNALTENDRVKALARTPMLLTMIALVHRDWHYLPIVRHDLYDRAVKTLISTWDESKGLNDQAILNPLNLADIRRLMEHLAYWIQTQGGSSRSESSTLVLRDDLVRELSNAIRNLKKIERYQALQVAEQFLDQIIRDRAGLLNRQSTDHYSFVHKTFQEYLAAQEILYRQGDKGFEVVLEHIEAHLHHSHWREVLLLLIAQQQDTDPDKVVNAVLAHPIAYESILHRNLLFAGRCLAEDISVCEELSNHVLQQLTRLEVSTASTVCPSMLEQVSQILCQMANTRYRQQAFEYLQEREYQIEATQFLKYRIAFGEREAVLQELRSLVAEGPTYEDPDYFFPALSLLEKLDKEQTTETLLEKLLSATGEIDYAVVMKLAELDEIPDQVIQIIIDHLVNGKTIPVMASFALSRATSVSEAALQLLLNHLDSSDGLLRREVSLILSNLGKTSEIVTQTFVSRLNHPDVEVQLEAIQTLSDLDNGSSEVLQHLLLQLENQSAEIRVNAATALIKLNPHSTESKVATRFLETLLDDEDPNVQLRVISALLEANPFREDFTETLLELLDSALYEDQIMAIKAICKLEVVANSLAQQLLTLDFDVIVHAFRSFTLCLGKVNNPSQDILDELLTFLRLDSDEAVQAASESLVRAARSCPQIVPALVSMIEQHSEEEWVNRPVDVLWRILEG